MADVELAVEVIGFVKQGAGEKFFPGFFKNVAAGVLGADGDFVGARHILAELGNAEAAFALGVLAFSVDDFGIDQNELGFGIFLEGNVDDGNAASDADLRGGEADTVGGVHGFEHVVEELLQVVVKDSNRLGGLFQNRIAELYDGIDHQNALSCWQYPWKLRRVSVIESPPNFSRAQRARVRATMASAATPAAGTTQTSERS